MNHLLKLCSILLLIITIFSCNNKNTTQNLETDAEFIKNSFITYNEMRNNNPKVVMNLSLNSSGKIVAKFQKNIGSLSLSPELLCKEDTYSNEFSNCVEKNVKAGICVTITNCAYCAHECAGGGIH